MNCKIKRLYFITTRLTLFFLCSIEILAAEQQPPHPNVSPATSLPQGTPPPPTVPAASPQVAPHVHATTDTSTQKRKRNSSHSKQSNINFPIEFDMKDNGRDKESYKKENNSYFRINAKGDFIVKGSNKDYKYPHLTVVGQVGEGFRTHVVFGSNNRTSPTVFFKVSPSGYELDDDHQQKHHDKYSKVPESKDSETKPVASPTAEQIQSAKNIMERFMKAYKDSNK